MKTIVFGGSGFIGSHVADTLSEAGHEVVIYDLKPSDYLQKSQKMIIGDILDKKLVVSSIKGCDYVYNFAGVSRLDDRKTNPQHTVEMNVIGNMNIMDGAIEAKARRFIYASSIYVYSQKGGFYRCSKQAAEIYIEEYQCRFGLDFTVMRYGTLYGTRADSGNSIYRYLKQALETGRITCTGSAEGVREYINVNDAARLSVDILSGEYLNQHVIITGHHAMKFKELVAMIGEMLGKEIEIEISKKKDPDHYDYIPYSFAPKIGKKLVNRYYLDMGQGLLECLHQIHTEAKN